MKPAQDRPGLAGRRGAALRAALALVALALVELALVAAVLAGAALATRPPALVPALVAPATLAAAFARPAVFDGPAALAGPAAFADWPALAACEVSLDPVPRAPATLRAAGGDLRASLGPPDGLPCPAGVGTVAAGLVSVGRPPRRSPSSRSRSPNTTATSRRNALTMSAAARRPSSANASALFLASCRARSEGRSSWSATWRARAAATPISAAAA